MTDAVDALSFGLSLFIPLDRVIPVNCSGESIDVGDIRKNLNGGFLIQAAGRDASIRERFVQNNERPVSARYRIATRQYRLLVDLREIRPGHGIFVAKTIAREREEVDLVAAAKAKWPFSAGPYFGCPIAVQESEEFPFPYDVRSLLPADERLDTLNELSGRLRRTQASLRLFLQIESQRCRLARKARATIRLGGTIDPDVVADLVADAASMSSKPPVAATILDKMQGVFPLGADIVLSPMGPDGNSHASKILGIDRRIVLLSSLEPLEEQSADAPPSPPPKDGEEFDVRLSNRPFLQRTQAVLRRLQNREAAGNWEHLAQMLIDASKLPLDPIRALESDGVSSDAIDDRLDDLQRAAVARAIGAGHAHFIQGPPGCGKTTVIAEIAKLYAERGETVLIAGPTHSAVDEVVRKIDSSHGPVPLRLGRTAEKINSGNLQYRPEEWRKNIEARFRTADLVDLEGAARREEAIRWRNRWAEWLRQRQTDDEKVKTFRAQIDLRKSELERLPSDRENDRAALEREVANRRAEIVDLETLVATEVAKVEADDRAAAAVHEAPRIEARSRTSRPDKTHGRAPGHRGAPARDSARDMEKLRALASHQKRTLSQKALTARRKQLDTAMEELRGVEARLAGVDLAWEERRAAIEADIAALGKSHGTPSYDRKGIAKTVEDRSAFATAIAIARSERNPVEPYAGKEQLRDKKDPASAYNRTITEVRRILDGDIGRKTVTEWVAALEAYIDVLDRRVKLQEACATLRTNAEAAAKELLGESRIVCSTIYGLSTKQLEEIGYTTFDVVIVDEASKITDDELLNVALDAKRWILVGDEKQLPPYVDHEGFTHLLALIAVEIAQNVLRPDSDLLKIINDVRREKQNITLGGERNVPWPKADTALDDLLEKESNEADGLIMSDANPDGPNEDEVQAERVADLPQNDAADDLPPHLEEAIFLVAHEWERDGSRPRIDEADILRAYRGFRDQLGAAGAAETRAVSKNFRAYRQRFGTPTDEDYMSGDVDPQDSAQANSDRMLRVYFALLKDADKFMFRSFFERAIRAVQTLPAEDGAQLCTRLENQRRMTDALGLLVAGPVYGGFYRPAVWSAREDAPTPLTLPEDFRKSITFLDTSAAGQPALEQEMGTSYRNTLEAKWLIQTLRVFDKSLARDCPRPQKRPTALGISFYRPQVEHIREQLEIDLKTKSLQAIDWKGIGTVDSFQGQEADLVILSFCRTQNSGWPNVRFGRWLQDIRRLNVAFTRARRALVVIGHAPTIENLCANAPAMDFFENLFHLLRTSEHAEMRRYGPEPVKLTRPQGRRS